MAKRSNFKKRKNDAFMTTDKRAVKALLPFLQRGQTFAEPCAGEMDLVNQLQEAGLMCTHLNDISWTPGGDALTQQYHGMDLIISNPPWTRQILHPMIVHFAKMAPTWLLFDSDWGVHAAGQTIFADVLRHRGDRPAQMGGRHQASGEGQLRLVSLRRESQRTDYFPRKESPVSSNRHNLPTRSEHYPRFLLCAATRWQSAAQLAAVVGVSMRTIYRFVELARREGYVVRAHNGAGGGIQISARPTCSRCAGYQRAVTVIDAPRHDRGAAPVLAGADPEIQTWDLVHGSE